MYIYTHTYTTLQRYTTDTHKVKSMNQIGLKIWGRDLTIKKWSQLNGFSYNTVRAVIRGERGKWMSGKSKKIKEALVNQGFANVDDFKSEA